MASIANKCVLNARTAVAAPSTRKLNAKASLNTAFFGAQKVAVVKIVGQTRAVKAATVTANLTGENPDWSDSDYIVLGLAHCFVKDDAAKLQDKFVVEAIPAGAVECMDNGGVTCYTHAFGTNLGVALKQDISLLPEEFQVGVFADEFDFRAKCASRTWKRQHPQEHLLQLVPEGKVRSDFNFSVEDKRVLNMENTVADSDNIKQDLSIDVYGREKEEDTEIEKLYNV